MAEENKDQDDLNESQEDLKGQSKDKSKEEIDSTIKALMSDPDGISKILGQKRKANEEAKSLRLKLEEIETKQKEADSDALKEQGKYKDLAEKSQAELKEKEEKFIKVIKILTLKMEAQKKEHGITDTDLVELIDLKEIKIDKDYHVENAKEVIEEFKGRKPDFFKEGEGEKETKSQEDSNKKPSLRQKIEGTLEGLNPTQRIVEGLKKSNK